MKTARRHELQTNQLANWLGDKILFAEKYATAIIVTVVAILVLGAAYLYVSRQSKLNQEQRWTALVMSPFLGLPPAELRKMADVDPDSEASIFAKFLLANRQLSEGVDELFQNRTDGMATLDSAVKHYKEVLRSTKQQLLLAQASLGLGKTYESQGKLDEARKQFKSIEEKWPKQVYAIEAQERLRDIDRKEAQGFYTWLSELKPKAVFGDLPGIPGLKPDLDLNKLDAENQDIKLGNTAGAKSSDETKSPEADKKNPGANTTEPKASAPAPKAGDATSADTKAADADPEAAKPETATPDAAKPADEKKPE